MHTILKYLIINIKFIFFKFVNRLFDFTRFILITIFFSLDIIILKCIFFVYELFLPIRCINLIFFMFFFTILIILTYFIMRFIRIFYINIKFILIIIILIWISINFLNIINIIINEILGKIFMILTVIIRINKNIIKLIYHLVC